MGECKICENPQDCANCEFKALIENLPNRDDDEDWINFFISRKSLVKR